MLTSLSFLEQGNEWPPACEAGRLDTYQSNRLLFSGRHDLVFRHQLERVCRVEGQFRDVLDYRVVLNYPRLVSCKVADLLFCEPPEIVGPLPEGIWVNAYEAALDVSRYGTGLLYVYAGAQGAVLDVARPEEWFPVYDGRRHIHAHVLAVPMQPEMLQQWCGNDQLWETQSTDTVKVLARRELHLLRKHGKHAHRDGEQPQTGQGVRWEGRMYEKGLAVEIHTPGHVERRAYLSDGQRMGPLVWSEEVDTGLPGFAVIPIHNTTTSDHPWGLDDYRDMDSLLSELEISLAQMSRILDRHANPSMQGPESALEWDKEAQCYTLRAGQYFITQEGERVEYLTWDAKLDACFAHFQRLLHQLYTVTEMGSVIFGDWSGHSGAIPSGAALKRLLIAPLSKVSRIKLRFEPALLEAVNSWRVLTGHGVVADAVRWKDGLPGEERLENDEYKANEGGAV